MEVAELDSQTHSCQIPPDEFKVVIIIESSGQKESEVMQSVPLPRKLNEYVED